MAEHERIKEQERARLAKQLLDNPLWVEAWAQLETRLQASWRTSQTGMAERRELIYFQLRAADEIRGYIAEILETGQMAEQQLAEERSNRGRTST